MKIFFNQLLPRLCKNWYLLFLLILLWISRLPVVIDGVIPFGFDHGKDSLAVLHMWLAKEPKFVGPWTSIPGLYFGPAWYYLVLPFYVLSKGNPVTPVIAMVVLHSLFVIVAYNFFGRLAATIYTCAATWFTISQSAWNPFPMPFVSLWLIIFLHQVKQEKKLQNKPAVILGILSALGFHFSTAYAIFYPIIVWLSILLRKIKFSFKQIIFYGLGFLIPMVPQILFELKNNFIETKGVLNYLKEGESQAFNLGKIWRVVFGTINELKISFLPEIWLANSSLKNILNQIIGLFFVFLLIVGIYQIWQKKNKKFIMNWCLDFLIWIEIPTIAFIFLHFNFWYLLGMMPMAVILVSRIINQNPKLNRLIFVGLLIAGAITQVDRYYVQDRLKLQASRAFLPVKLETIAYIREKAEDKPFAVYHYVPDIYDFSYQYLYFQQAWQGLSLPAEFTYQPNVTPYIAEKEDLLKYFTTKGMADNREPELVFFVVEKPENKDFLQDWWNQQHYQEILNEKKISQDVIVYEGIR